MRAAVMPAASQASTVLAYVLAALLPAAAAPFTGLPHPAPLTSYGSILTCWAALISAVVARSAPREAAIPLLAAAGYLAASSAPSPPALLLGAGLVVVAAACPPRLARSALAPLLTAAALAYALL